VFKAACACCVCAYDATFSFDILRCRYAAIVCSLHAASATLILIFMPMPLLMLLRLMPPLFASAFSPILLMMRLLLPLMMPMPPAA